MWPMLRYQQLAAMDENEPSQQAQSTNLIQVTVKFVHVISGKYKHIKHIKTYKTQYQKHIKSFKSVLNQQMCVYI